MLFRSCRRCVSTIQRSYSTVIIGGSVVGSSVAYHLATAGVKDIAVIERDPAYKYASAVLSAGGIRQQFSLPENVELSMYGIGMIKNPGLLAVDDHEPCFQFRENGYLFLASEKGKDILLENNRTQHNCGADWVKIMEPTELKEKFPWLNMEGIALGSFGQKNEGYFDPWSLLSALKAKSISLGVTYIKGEACDFNVSHSDNGTPIIDSVLIRQLTANDEHMHVEEIKGQTFVNCAGAWSAGLVEAAALRSARPEAVFRLPVERRKRAVFSILAGASGPEEPDRIVPENSPLTIDPNGVYFRSESNKFGKYICGVSPSEETDGPSFLDADLQCTDHHLFDDIIWPTLYERVPAFDRLKVESFWSGFYDYNVFDQNMIIGHHPEIRNMVVCTGMSGHGLQQSPGAGRAVTELLTEGKFITTNLSRFGFDRVIDKKPLYEVGIV